jgi:hypothetical protein
LAKQVQEFRWNAQAVETQTLSEQCQRRAVYFCVVRLVLWHYLTAACVGVVAIVLVLISGVDVVAITLV